MKPISKVLYPLLAVALCFSLLPLSGCQNKSDSTEFPNGRYVAELATLECYYHNVAKYEDSSPLPIDLLNLFHKKMWFEYTGIVKIGIDASKVKISSPDSSGVVTIAIPQAEILGNPDIDTNSMSDPITDTFPPIIVNISAEEKMKALNDAQDKMKTAAEGNENLKFQARERAKALLEQYVKNVGNELGKSYTVQWTDAE